MNSDEQIDSLSSPYSPESLSPSSRSLLECICKNVTGASLGKRSKNSTVHQWDAVAFENFVERMFPEERECFLRLLIEKDVKYKTTFKKISLEGVGEHTALKVFCSSAEAQKKHLDIFLKDYIQYSDNFGLKPERLIGHEGAIKSLLGVGDTSPQKNAEEVDIPLHSPQDHIAINAEIEKIKKDLKFYPFVKNQIQIKNSKSEYSTALSKIEKLLSLSPDNVELTAFKITILILLKQKDEALGLAKPLYDEHSEDERAMNSYSVVLSSSGNYKKALSVARKAREASKLAPSLSLNIGMFLERLGKFEDAIREYECTVDLDEDYLKPYYRISLCYARLNQIENSEAAILRAKRIAPDNHDVLLQWIKIKNRQGKFNEIAEIITEHLSSKDHGIAERYLAASLALLDEDVDGAEKIMSKVLNDIELNLFGSGDDKSQVYALLATVFHEKSGADRKYLNHTKEYYKKSLELNPKNSTALEGLVEISYLSGECNAAKKYLEQVSNLYDEYTVFGKYGWEVYIQLSIVAKEQKFEHLEPLLWCVERYKSDIECRIYLARGYIELDNVIDSKYHIDIALDIFDDIIDVADLSIREAQSCAELGGLIVWFEGAAPQELDYLPKALEIFEKLSTGLTKDRDFPLWIDAMYNKAEVLRLLGADAQDSNVSNKAICAFEKLLEACPSFEYQDLCDDIQGKIDGINLGKISS